MAKARPIPGLREEDSYSLAAAKVVAVRAGELAEHSAGVLDMSDIEAVHRMRVATRRLRAALEVFEPCFPRKPYKRALREVKQLADALGERRDRDVTIKALGEFAAAAGRADQPGVESLVAKLRREQAEANDSLAPSVSGERLTRLCELLARLVEAARERAGDGPVGQVEAIALDQIPAPLSAPPVPAGATNGSGGK